jgi:GNAT superfamily N-acetyltransferase
MTLPADRPATTPATNSQDPATAWTWVPIRSLAPRHHGRIAAHLLALDQSDRYLRFGYPASDAQIVKYVDTLDFEQDEVFGIFNRRLELIALAHLAHAESDASGKPGSMSEFGVSVLRKARGRGFGARLFEHAVLHARNRGVQTLFIHALSENAAMLKIARNAGATVERDGSESQAWLRLPPDTLASRIEQVFGDQAAEIDYQLKLNASRVQSLMDAISK